MKVEAKKKSDKTEKQACTKVSALVTSNSSVGALCHGVTNSSPALGTLMICKTWKANEEIRFVSYLATNVWSSHTPVLQNSWYCRKEEPLMT